MDLEVSINRTLDLTGMQWDCWKGMLTARCKLTFGASLAFLGHKGTLLQNTQSLRLHPTPLLQDSLACGVSSSHSFWGTGPLYGLEL